MQAACAALNAACANPKIVAECFVEQSRSFQQGSLEGQVADDADADLNAHWGVAVASSNSILPEGWIEPALDSMTPSGYLTKMLSEIQDRYYPTRNQLQVLAVFAEHLDNLKMQEFAGTPWNLREQLVLLLWDKGGAAKPGWRKSS